MVIEFCLIGLIIFVIMLIWHTWQVDLIKASFRKRHDEAERYWITRNEHQDRRLTEQTNEHFKAINSQARDYRMQIEGLARALEEAKARSPVSEPSPIPKPSPIAEPKQGDPLSGPPFIPDMPGTPPTKAGGRWVDPSLEALNSGKS